MATLAPNGVGAHAGAGRRSQNVVIIAVGGPTCSGKTTLSKHLNAIIPGSIILHQDDFTLPSDQIPIHPVHGVQDWDDPRGAIEWPRWRSCLEYIHTHGRLPEDHSSHDDLNILPGVPIPDSIVQEWQPRFASLTSPISSTLAVNGVAPSKGKRRASLDDNAEEDEAVAFSPPDTLFVIADGFLLYWDELSVAQYDIKFFVRESYAVLKHRREVRQTYHTADGLTWRDPPNYWDAIVWPAFLLSHRHAFVEGDVEEGTPDEASVAGKGMVVLRPKEGGEGMARMVQTALEEIWRVAVGEARREPQTEVAN